MGYQYPIVDEQSVSLKVIDCVFSGAGCAITKDKGKSLTISGCYFDGCDNLKKGIVYLGDEENAFVGKCSVIGNTFVNLKSPAIVRRSDQSIFSASRHIDCWQEGDNKHMIGMTIVNNKAKGNDKG